MNKRFMKRVRNAGMKYWKIVVPVFVAVIAIIAGIGIASAADVTVVIESSNTNYLNSGETVTFTATATGAEEDLTGEFIWSSDDPNIALIQTPYTTVNNRTSSVTISAVGAGSASITATYVVGSETYGTDTENVVVKLVIGNKPTTTLNQPVGSTIDFTTNAASSTTLTWTSSNPTVASVTTVGTNGRLTVNGSGTATITATATNVVSDSFEIVFKSLITETGSEIVVESNETNRVVSTNAAVATNLQYRSSDEEVFGVTASGVIVPRKAGEGRVFVYPNTNLVLADGDSIAVRVNFGILASSNSVAVGNTLNLSTNTDSPSVSWATSNASIATVNPTTGVLTAHSQGNVVITATVQDPALFSGVLQTAQYQVEVIDSFGLTFTEYTASVGESFTIKGIVTDNSANLTWSSSDENIATVIDGTEQFTAQVEALARGTSVITATQTVGGITMTASCRVTVVQPVENVDISQSEVTVEIDQTYPLIATFNPPNSDNKTVRWVSSDPSIATVTGDGYFTGYVRGVSGGVAIISVISEDGLQVANCRVTVRQPVTGITLNATSVEISQSVGQYQMTYNITPENATYKDVTWSSSNESVATVNSSGLVTFIAPGNATIIAKTVDVGTNGNLIATCGFYITVPVSGINLDYDTITIDVGTTQRLTGLIQPESASNKLIEWTTTDATVATVDATGLVRGVGSGYATIMARTDDGGFVDTCRVYVEQPVTTVTLSNTSANVRIGDIYWLFATANPANATNKNIIWTSADPGIATVDDNGMITGVGAGDVYITATSADSGVSARCLVTVTQAVTGISLNHTEMLIQQGEKFMIIPTVSPVDATNKSVTFSSSDDAVATVDDRGIVTGVAGGTAIVVVTTVERGLIASCAVTVQEYTNSVEITGAPSTISNGDARQLSVSVLPLTATDRRVNWFSSNTGVLTVDASGRITGRGYGVATISAIATDGSGAYDSVVIRVIQPVSTINIQPTTVTIMEGETAQVTATVLPGNATVKDLNWSSSNEDVAIVDHTGSILAVKAGTATITAASSDGSGIVGTCRVTVKRTIPASSVTINTRTLNLLPGQTQTLTARVRPTSTTESLVWFSGDPSVATVSSSGVVYARGQGNTEIYAMSSYGTVESSCEVNVLAMNASYIKLEQYDSYYLDVFGATGPITWYSNNQRVATVGRDGRVIGRMRGTTTITGKANGKLLYCTVRVDTMP